MISLIHLLKILHHINTPCMRRITTVNFGNSLDLSVLLNQKTLRYLNSQSQRYLCKTNNHASLNDVEIQQQIDQDIITNKWNLKLKEEIYKYGIIKTTHIIEDMVTGIMKSENITSDKGLFLLRHCSEIMMYAPSKVRLKWGIDIYSMLKKHEATLNVLHYNALLSVYIENEYEFSPFDILEEMASLDLKPNTETFNKIFSYYCNQGKLEEVLEIVKHAENKQMNFNREIMSQFLWDHFMNNHTHLVDETFKTMEFYDIPPTILTYSIILYDHARKGDIENIKKTLKNCDTKGILVSVEVLLNIVYHLSLNGHTQHVDEILSMTSKGIIYEREANKLIFKLIEKNCENVAIKIYETLPKDINEINKYSYLFPKFENWYGYVSEGINQNEIYSNTSMEKIDQAVESIISKMRVWKDFNGFIKEYCFYTILENFEQAHNFEGIKQILWKMIVEFEIYHPSIYLLTKYIIPHINRPINEVYTVLKENLISNKKAANACLLYLLKENKISEALIFVSTHCCKYKIEILKPSLLEAFKNTQDVPSFVSLLHYLYFLIDNNDPDEFSNFEKKYLPQLFLETSIFEIFKFLNINNNTYLIKMFFRNLSDKGFNISPEIADKIENLINDAEDITLHTNVINYLNNLKSGHLALKPIRLYNRYDSYNEENELKNKFLDTIKTVDKNTKILKIRLLKYFCAIGNEEKVLQLMEIFEKSDEKIPISVYTDIMTMYSSLRQFDKVEFWFHKLKTDFPNCRMRKSLQLALAQNILKRGELAESIKYLKYPTINLNIIMTNSSRNFINLASKYVDKEEELLEIIEVLHEYGYVNRESYAILFLDVIKFNLARGDAEAALQKFISLYRQYKKTIGIYELLVKFTNDNDQNSIFKIQNICIKNKEEKVFYINLAIAYMYNDNLGEAINILKTEFSTIPAEEILDFIQKFYKDDDVKNLEKLQEIFDKLNYYVPELYDLLLKIYSEKKEWKNCHKLWQKMENQKYEPSSTFIGHLMFVLNKKKEHKEFDTLKKFEHALKEDDFHIAKSLLDSFPKEMKSECYSRLCQELLRKTGFSEILNLWRDLHERFNLNLNDNTAISILRSMSKTKAVQYIESIEKFLSWHNKIELDFEYFLSKAHLRAGSWNLYLKKLENRINSGQDFLASDSIRILVQSLLIHPELCKQYESLTIKFMEKNNWTPATALWLYYFLKNNPKADVLWKTFSNNLEAADWYKLIHQIFYFHWLIDNPDDCLKIAKFIEQSSIDFDCDIGTKIKLEKYTALIKKCMSLDHPIKYEYALKCLKHGINSGLLIDEFDIQLLVELETKLRESGIEWPAINDYNVNKK